jgi:hypothetical protein
MKNSIKLFPLIVGLTVTGVVSFGIGITILLSNFKESNNRTQVTKEFAVSDFTQVRFDGISDVVIIQGDVEKLVATGYQSAVESVDATVANGLLKIAQRNPKFEIITFGYNKAVSYTLYTKSLSSIENRGIGSITANSFSTDKLSITNDGIGEMILNGLQVKELKAYTKGTGTIEVSGRADTLSTRVEGTGTFEGFSLLSNNCTAVLEGMGSIEVSCKDTLDANLDGMGDISYEGDPKVTQRVKGLGEISKR